MWNLFNRETLFLHAANGKVLCINEHTFLLKTSRVYCPKRQHQTGSFQSQHSLMYGCESLNINMTYMYMYLSLLHFRLSELDFLKVEV